VSLVVPIFVAIVTVMSDNLSAGASIGFPPGARGWSLESVQEGHQVSSFLPRENKAQVNLVVADHTLERRGNAVVEVRRPRRESPNRRRLEATEVIPESGDVAPARIGQLAALARRSVEEGVEGQIRGARLGRLCETSTSLR
jgi:hypothetical protein